MKQADDVCDCGHARTLHDHYTGRHRLYCGRCNCSRFTQRLIYRERAGRWLRNLLAR